MRIRYAFVLNLLPAAFLADEVDAQAIERHVEYAIKSLFTHLEIPFVFIPGDDGDRPGDRTEIDIVCELGEGSGRTEVDVPHP